MRTQPMLVPVGAELGAAGRFNWMGSCISLGGRISEQMSLRIQRTLLIFAHLRHLWLWRDSRLLVTC